MFASITPLARQAGRTRPAAVPNARPHRIPAAPSLDEAYETRLLAEVARWDDQAAFEEIHARHHAAVVATAYALCGDLDVAHDIAQQTFTALWVRAERLAAKSMRLRPWLTTVARDAAIAHAGAERDIAPLSDAARRAAGAAGPIDTILMRETSVELRAAFATLPRDGRVAIECIYLRDMTFAQGAAVLRIPVGTLKSRVRAALAHLRARLDCACC